MPHLSDIFNQLAERDQRNFAGTAPDMSVITDARRARQRTRVLQATGGALAVGGLAVGGAQLLPSAGTTTLEAASSDTAPAMETESATEVEGGATEATDDAPEVTEPAGETNVVSFDKSQWETSDSNALQRIEDTFACSADAPTPTTGAATISLDNLDIRGEEYVLNLGTLGPEATGPEDVPVIETSGSWWDDMAGKASVVSTNGDALHADLSASAILFVKDGEIVEIFGANYINPGEDFREIPAPADYDGDAVGPDTESEAGITAVLTDEATSLVTGYSAWGCVPGSGDVDMGDSITTYDTAADFLESGEYEVYLVAEVNVTDQTAALHALRNLDVDLYNAWTLEQQFDDLGLNHHTESDEDWDYDYLYVDVPVPADTIPAQNTSELLVAEAITVTIP